MESEQVSAERVPIYGRAAYHQDGRYYAIYVTGEAFDEGWTQAERFAEVEHMARDWIAVTLDVPYEDVEVTVMPNDDVPRSRRPSSYRNASRYSRYYSPKDRERWTRSMQGFGHPAANPPESGRRDGFAGQAPLPEEERCQIKPSLPRRNRRRRRRSR